MIREILASGLCDCVVPQPLGIQPTVLDKVSHYDSDYRYPDFAHFES